MSILKKNVVFYRPGNSYYDFYYWGIEKDEKMSLTGYINNIDESEVNKIEYLVPKVYCSNDFENIKIIFLHFGIYRDQKRLSAEYTEMKKKNPMILKKLSRRITNDLYFADEILKYIMKLYYIEEPTGAERNNGIVSVAHDLHDYSLGKKSGLTLNECYKKCSSIVKPLAELYDITLDSSNPLYLISGISKNEKKLEKIEDKAVLKSHK